MSFISDLQTLITKEGTLTNNKVSNFSYDSYAYEHDLANGTATYDFENHNNIPTNDPSVIKTNPTVVAKGFRSQVSTLPRMLINHIFGRVSYNLNKTVDVLNAFLSSVSTYLGAPNGFASLDSNGRIPYSQLPESAVELKGYWNASTNTPTLVDGTGDNGDEYFVEVAGSQDLGSGEQYFKVGDRVVYSGGIWKNIDSGSVRSVNSVVPDAQGDVPLKGTDIPVSADYAVSLTERLQDTFINGAYSGRELKQALGKSTVAQVMQDLIARRKAHNYRGIGIGDHLTLPSLTVDGTAVENKATVQIAGFDLYKGKSLTDTSKGTLTGSLDKIMFIVNNIAVTEHFMVYSTSDGGDTFNFETTLDVSKIIDIGYYDRYYMLAKQQGSASVKVFTSTDGITWSVVYTFSYTASCTKMHSMTEISLNTTYGFFAVNTSSGDILQYTLANGAVTESQYTIQPSSLNDILNYISDFTESVDTTNSVVSYIILGKKTGSSTLYMVGISTWLGDSRRYSIRSSLTGTTDLNGALIQRYTYSVTPSNRRSVAVYANEDGFWGCAIYWDGATSATIGGAIVSVSLDACVALSHSEVRAVGEPTVGEPAYTIDVYECETIDVQSSITPTYTATLSESVGHITCVNKEQNVLLGGYISLVSKIFKRNSVSPYIFSLVWSNDIQSYTISDIVYSSARILVVANKLLFRRQLSVDMERLFVSGDFNSACYGNSLYVAVGDNGLILKSSDTTSWTDVSVSAVTSDLLFVRYINGLFVAVGTNGTILTSTDATSWTLRTTGVVASLFSVCYGNGAYVVTGEDGTILRSADATSWSSKTSGVLVDLKRGVYVQKTFLVIGENNTVIQSADGEDWATKTIEGLDFDIADICASDIYCAIAGENTVLISQDLNYWNKFTNVKFSDNVSAEITKINEGVTTAGNETFYICGNGSAELREISAITANNSESIVLLIDTHTIVDVSDLDAVVDIDDVATALGIDSTDIPFVRRSGVSDRQHFFLKGDEVRGDISVFLLPLFRIMPSERCREDSWYVLGYSVLTDGSFTSVSTPSDSRLVFLVTL